jgi:2'-5' RNA ligase
MSKKRIFAGIPVRIPAGYSTLLNSWRIKYAHEKIKWVPSKNLHITLFFYGDSSNENITRISEELKNTIERVAAFELNIAGMGFFPSIHRPRVVYVASELNPSLIELNNACKNVASALEYDVPDMQYVPHITLARINYLHQNSAFKDAIKAASRSMKFQLSVDEVILYESVLEPTGAKYQAIEIFKLK